MQSYYYSREGTDVVGPISDLDLWKMVQAGILPPSVQVCREGSEEWTAINFPALVAADSVSSPELPPTDAATEIIVRCEEESTAEREEQLGTTPPATSDVHREKKSRARHEPNSRKKRREERERNNRVVAIIGNYGWGAMGAMVAIPVPGADFAATFAVWGKMIAEIAGVYGYQIDAEDAKRLGSDLFKGVIVTTAAWFASAKTASFIFKFIPVGGTIAGYAIDAAIAGFGAKKITARLGTAAALYYQSGKTMAPETMAAHVKNVADPQTIRSALSLFSVGVSMGGLDDLPDMNDHHGHSA